MAPESDRAFRSRCGPSSVWSRRRRIPTRSRTRRRNVPLACLFGTLGAAVVYILSTTVIQGIVPNPELAKSTGPFGLAYAHMFNPTIGSIVMGLAILACLGSLLGWQFTISQTAKGCGGRSPVSQVLLQDKQAWVHP